MASTASTTLLTQAAVGTAAEKPVSRPGRPRSLTQTGRLNLKIQTSVLDTLRSFAATAGIAPSRYVERSINQTAMMDRLNVSAFIPVDLDDPRSEELIARARELGGTLVVLGVPTMK